MDLKFHGQSMVLDSINVRSEAHGETREAASDVGLYARLPNDILDVFSKDLKPLLYTFDPKRDRDLADQARVGTQGYFPDLRMPQLGDKKAILWGEEVTNVRVSIRKPGTSGDKHEVVIAPAKINRFSFLPLDGGTVEFAMRVQFHPSGVLGKLGEEMVVQTEVEVSVEPIPETQAEVAAT